MMGYYTSYDLSIEPYDEEIRKQLLKEVNDGDNPFEDLCKWCEWEEDMKKFSSKHPDHTFHLSGIGEIHDDQWKATFKNGKAHIRYCTIIIDDYDEACLT